MLAQASAAAARHLGTDASFAATPLLAIIGSRDQYFGAWPGSMAHKVAAAAAAGNSSHSSSKWLSNKWEVGRSRCPSSFSL